MGIKSVIAGIAMVCTVSAAEASTNSYKAVVTRVLDGDTVEMNISLGFGITMDTPCRLYGINTPELHKATMESAVAARDVLLSYVTNRVVTVLTVDDRKDKYGRLLGIIISGGTNVNQLLLDRGYAVPMDDSGHASGARKYKPPRTRQKH